MDDGKRLDINESKLNQITDEQINQAINNVLQYHHIPGQSRIGVIPLDFLMINYPNVVNIFDDQIIFLLLDNLNKILS